MASPAPEGSAGAKRKRTPIPEPAHPPVGHPSSNITQINYLAKARTEKLKLIEGDAETFSDVLGMIDDYEGVLQRHESLAANLGAKLVGPLLLKSFEKLFDGPIKVIQTSFGLEQSPVSWLDIVNFARSSPGEFLLTESGAGVKTCRFWIKGGQVEISEDDYRLVMSGGPERMIPTQAIAEDESAELATLTILESRLAMLIKKADAVASRARQLNYHLKGRKTAVLKRKATEQPNTDNVERKFSPQPYSTVNPRSPVPPNGEGVKIQQQLLEQFLTSPHRSGSSRRSSIANPRPKAAVRAPIPAPVESPTHFHTFASSNNAQEHADRRMSHPLTSSEDGNESQYRILMATKIEKLAKGEPIVPPCDRCRRLKFDCTKHLTACTACTKKHGKCSWKDVRDGEVEHGASTPYSAQSVHEPTQPQNPGENGVPVKSGGIDNGAGNGYPGIEASQGQSHLDPNLRNVLPPISAQLGGEQRQKERDRERERERERKMSTGHDMLAHIASAAAAAGPR